MKAHDGDWLCMPDPRAPLYLLSASPVRALGVLGMAFFQLLSHFLSEALISFPVLPQVRSSPPCSERAQVTHLRLCGE